MRSARSRDNSRLLGGSGRLSEKRWDLNEVLKGERNEMLSFHASPLTANNDLFGNP